VPRLVGRDSVQLLVCAFERATMEQIANDFDRPTSGLRLTVAARDAAIVQLCRLLEDEAASGGLSGTLYAESLAHALAMRFLLLSSEDARLRTATRRPSGRLPQRSLQQVLDAMRAQIANPPGLRALASISRYTPHHFLRMFRAATGLTPHRYLLGLRIERAQELLQHTRLSLIEVADQTGFSSQAHMTTVFRQHTGTTPGMWRRAHRVQFSVEFARS
jgi:AraC family transcriptional regulator